MGGEDVELLERVAVDKTRNALARGQLALRVLAVERLGVAMPGFVLALPQLVERIDLLGFGFGHCSLADSSNIRRCPSRSSTRQWRPSGGSSGSERLTAPATRARSPCAQTSSTWTSTPSMMHGTPDHLRAAAQVSRWCFGLW